MLLYNFQFLGITFGLPGVTKLQFRESQNFNSGSHKTSIFLLRVLYSSPIGNTTTSKEPTSCGTQGRKKITKKDRGFSVFAQLEFVDIFFT